MTVLLISKFKVLKNHADETDGSFMSETTFNKWLADKRTTPLDSDWRKVIQSLFVKHVKKKQNKLLSLSVKLKE